MIMNGTIRAELSGWLRLGFKSSGCVNAKFKPPMALEDNDLNEVYDFAAPSA